MANASRKRLPPAGMIVLGLALPVCIALTCSPANALEYYEIDPARTSSFFEYKQWGLSRQRADFGHSSGFLAVDGTAKVVDIRIEIDAASLSSGNEVFDEMLHSEEFFDVTNYPTIAFQSSRLQFDQERLLEVEGLLTIKDITRPISLQVFDYRCGVTNVDGKRSCGAEATGSLSRSDFKMSRYVPFVSDEVHLSIFLEAVATE